MRCLNALEPEKREMVLLAYYRGASREALAARIQGARRHGEDVAAAQPRRAQGLPVVMSLSPDDEGLAAEYALGTLDAGERATVAARRLRETGTGRRDRRLGGAVRAAARGRRRSSRRPPISRHASRRALRRAAGGAISPKSCARRLARWRALAGGAGALAAALAAALAFVCHAAPVTPHQFVAVLQKSPDAPAFAMTVNIDKLEFSVRPVAAPAPAGKSYELWIIAPQQAPKSLGVIDAATGRAAAQPPIPRSVRDATYAVTVEPKGGSPDGKPSGAPVFFGKLVPVGP